MKSLILLIFLCSCTIGTTNKITTNQYPCDTDSLGRKIQTVNLYINEKQPNKK